MFIFTLQSSQLSVCVCLRSTDPVMNNLFHAGNTFCETQQSSVGTLQSTDWGVLNYSSYYAVKQREKHTLTRPFQKMSLSCARLILGTQTQIEPFYLGEEEDAAREPAESVLQRAEPHLHIRTGCHSLLCVQQLYGTVNSNHLRNDFGQMHICFFRSSFDI